ncbi:peptidoglycan recognition protein family protein [Saccharothrix sp. Mg75]|uniref:peptidoglycan recognition protein family protein n=1 Tax=Saccharothrix sp. Mg75 TaxID=3445357 RepID=UPI003EEFFE32
MAAYGSNSRNGAKVRLVVAHTAEGARTRGDLAAFFDGNDNASSHAVIDAGGVLDLVDRSRAAWTLGSGNPISVNAEMCAFARWTRAQWLSESPVDGCANPRQIVRNFAAWAARECDALGIPKRVLTVEQVRAGQAGICDHRTYNRAYGAGDHWDVGDGFPWDVFTNDLDGGDDMPTKDEFKAWTQEAIIQLRGNDGRNVLDGVIQTRNEPRDRAREAVALELAGLRAAFDQLAQAYAQERDLDAAKIKQAVAEAIRENVVRVDVNVKSASAVE